MEGDPNNFTVPSFIGSTFEDAKVLMLGSNLTIGDITLIGDTLRNKPIILKQNPVAGENIKVGDAVDLWIGAPGSSVPNDDNDTDASL
jgi:beta-lactam-binding protein with PASTA domain